MLFNKTYQNHSVLTEIMACQSWCIFWDAVYITNNGSEGLVIQLHNTDTETNYAHSTTA